MRAIDDMLDRLGLDRSALTSGDLEVRTPITGETLAHVARTDAGGYGRNGLLLRFQHRVVGIALLRGGFAETNSAGHVRAVTLPDYTEVERYESPAGQLGGGGVAVRQS